MRPSARICVVLAGGGGRRRGGRAVPRGARRRRCPCRRTVRPVLLTPARTGGATGTGGSRPGTGGTRPSGRPPATPTDVDAVLGQGPGADRVAVDGEAQRVAPMTARRGFATSAETARPAHGADRSLRLWTWMPCHHRFRDRDEFTYRPRDHFIRMEHYSLGWFNFDPPRGAWGNAIEAFPVHTRLVSAASLLAITHSSIRLHQGVLTCQEGVLPLSIHGRLWIS